MAELQEKTIQRNIKIKPGTVDLCFVLDVTESMDPYRDGLKTCIKSLLSNLSNFIYQQIRVSLVCFRDDIKVPDKAKDPEGYFCWQEWTKSTCYVPPPEKFEFTDFETYNKEQVEQSDFFKKLQSVKCEGGFDTPEDVEGGIEKALTLSWNPNPDKKLVILITDSPSHGSNISPDPNPKTKKAPLDEFPERDITNTIKKLAGQGFTFLVFTMNDSTQKMCNLFEKLYSENNVGHRFHQQKLKELDKDLTPAQYQQMVQEIGAAIGQFVEATIRRFPKKF